MWDTSKQPPPQLAQQHPQMQPPIQVQVYNIPASSVPQYPAVQPVQQNEGWFKRNNKNKPQSNSVGTGMQLLVLFFKFEN